MLTPDQLAAIRARAKKADPGPWFDEPSGTPYAREVCVRETNEHVCDCEHCECDEQDVEIAAIAYVEHVEPHKACANAAFIAAARADVPALLAHVEALEAENRELREKAKHWECEWEAAVVDGCPIAAHHVQIACGMLFDAGMLLQEERNCSEGIKPCRTCAVEAEPSP